MTMMNRSRFPRRQFLQAVSGLAAGALGTVGVITAIAGGPFVGHPQVKSGACGLVPVDMFIPGCPPHPLTILDGLLRLLGRLPQDKT